MLPLWAASVALHVVILGVCWLVSWCVRRWVRPWEWVGWSRSLLEMLATISVCAPMFELDVLDAEYGRWAVFVQVLLLEFFLWRTLGDCEASPLCLASEEWLRSVPSLGSLRWIVGGQLVGGLVSCLPVYGVWFLGLHERHERAYLAPDLGPCRVDLNVWWVFGAFIEATAVFIYRVFELRLQRTSLSPTVQAALNSLLVASLTALGLRLTGMYCNPIEAFACIFNCEGLSWSGHVIVYWLGPLLGYWLAQIHVDTA